MIFNVFYFCQLRNNKSAPRQAALRNFFATQKKNTPERAGGVGGGGLPPRLSVFVFVAVNLWRRQCLCTGGGG